MIHLTRQVHTPQGLGFIKEYVNIGKQVFYKIELINGTEIICEQYEVKAVGNGR